MVTLTELLVFIDPYFHLCSWSSSLSLYFHHTAERKDANPFDMPVDKRYVANIW